MLKLSDIKEGSKIIIHDVYMLDGEYFGATSDNIYTISNVFKDSFCIDFNDEFVESPYFPESDLEYITLIE